jgi:hypothetical protein
MKQQFQKRSDQTRELIVQEVTDSLLMPTGELGAALLGAIFVVIFVWSMLSVS